MQSIDGGLKEAGPPHAVHKDEHSSKEDECEPVDFPDDLKPFGAENDDG